jgi:hypothetical protein
VPDWDNTESRERDEDAAWRDLIARFGAPAMDGPVPWPEREDVPATPGAGGDGADRINGAHGDVGSGEVLPEGTASGRATDRARDGGGVPGGEPDESGTPDAAFGDSGAAGGGRDGGEDGARGNGVEAGGAPGAGGAAGAGGASGAEMVRGPGGTVDADRIWRALEAEGLLGQTEPDVIQVTRRLSRTPAEWVPVRPTPAEEEDEGHFVPPEPPPLPTLDPVTKGAWAALFGGPGYLMIATALHWSVPGYAAFFAVAAFVTGFALLVIRMNDPGPGGPDDGDDGAVV